MWRNPHQATSGPMWQSMWGSETDPVLSAGGVYLANAATGLLLPGFTYTRSGPDLWCPQSDGSLASFAANVIPREFSGGRWGFRFDPGWTQYAQWSADLTNASWTKTRCSAANVAFANPFGGSVISKISEDTSASLSHLAQSSVTTSVTGAGYTARSIIYPDERKHAALCFTGGGGGTDRGVFVDLLTGAITGAFGAYPASYGAALRVDGGVDVFITETAPGAAGYAARVYLCSAQNVSVYTGDGVSGLRVAALNLTNTSYPVPLTVAQGTAGTVGNHSCSALLSALGISLGAEYTIGVEYTSATTATDKVVLGLSSGAFANSIYVIPRNGAGSQSFSMLSGNVPQLEAMSGAAAAVGAIQKSSLRAKQNDSRASINGALLSQDASCVLPVGLTNIRLGGAPWGGAANDFAGHVHKLWLAPSRALTDTELQAITA